MDVTFLISTYNRRDVLARTLMELREVAKRCGRLTETIVVDNASTDGTAAMISADFPEMKLFAEQRNRGACAKNVGLTHAAGRFVVFLDDDSYPTPQSIGRMIRHFEQNPSLGAAVFDVILPSGLHECSAYPNVFIGCGTGFRREALLEVGGLPTDYFMQAEEYDLSIRLLDAGWDVQRFDDLQVHHLKTIGARIPTRTTRLDVRNNLSFVTRHFPSRWMIPFALDWMRRYRWIAQSKGWRHEMAFWRGLVEGLIRACRPGHRKPVSPEAFEKLVMIDAIQQRLQREVAAKGYRSILLVDVGKNILPFWLAARRCGVRVVAISDTKLAGRQRVYRGVRIVDDATAIGLDFDAAVIANVSPVHAAIRRKQFRRHTAWPVIDLFEPSFEAISLAA